MLVAQVFADEYISTNSKSQVPISKIILMSFKLEFYSEVWYTYGETS